MAEWSKAAVLKSELAGPSGAEHAETAGNPGDDSSRSVPLDNALPFQTPLSALSTAAISPRVALLAALFDGARAAALAGDLDAARVAHEAIGKLLGAAAPSGEGVEGNGAPVVDLAEERRRRER